MTLDQVEKLQSVADDHKPESISPPESDVKKSIQHKKQKSALLRILYPHLLEEVEKALQSVADDHKPESISPPESDVQKSIQDNKQKIKGICSDIQEIIRDHHQEIKGICSYISEISKQNQVVTACIAVGALTYVILVGVNLRDAFIGLMCGLFIGLICGLFIGLICGFFIASFRRISTPIKEESRNVASKHITPQKAVTFQNILIPGAECARIMENLIRRAKDEKSLAILKSNLYLHYYCGQPEAAVLFHAVIKEISQSLRSAINDDVLKHVTVKMMTKMVTFIYKDIEEKLVTYFELNNEKSA